MNVLKRFKYLMIAMFGLAFSLTLASCQKNEADPNGFYESKTNISEDGFDFDKAHLSSIIIDTSKAKTVFFLGEKFTAEGISITANFLNEDNKLGSLVTTDFTVDTKEVDMFNIGTYPVTVTFRYKSVVEKQKYDIDVISSELLASGKEYVGGIDLTYTSGAKTYKGEFSMELGTQLNLDVNNFSVNEHVFIGDKEQGNPRPVASSEYSTDGSKAVKIDATNVDTTKRGDYVIKVEYNPEPINVDGKKLEYTVKAFLIVHILDKITNVKFVSGTTSFAATAGTFDYLDWTFKVTRKNSGDSTITYNSKDFTVDGIVSFIAGSQAAKINYLDYDSVVTVPVTVTESVDYDIATGNIYKLVKNSSGDEVCQGEVWKSALSTTKLTNVLDENLDSSGMFKISKPSAYVERKLKDDGTANDKYGKVYFGQRPTIKGKGSYISVQMDNPGVLVVYAASTGSTPRDVCVFDAPDSGEEIGTEYIVSLTQLEFKIEKAGTYYIQSFEGGIYVHGVVVAVAK